MSKESRKPLAHDTIMIQKGDSLSITIWPNGLTMQRRRGEGKKWETVGEVNIPQGALERLVARIIGKYLPAMYAGEQ